MAEYRRNWLDTTVEDFEEAKQDRVITLIKEQKWVDAKAIDLSLYNAIEYPWHGHTEQDFLALHASLSHLKRQIESICSEYAVKFELTDRQSEIYEAYFKNPIMVYEKKGGCGYELVCDGVHRTAAAQRTVFQNVLPVFVVADYRPDDVTFEQYRDRNPCSSWRFLLSDIAKVNSPIGATEVFETEEDDDEEARGSISTTVDILGTPYEIFIQDHECNPTFDEHDVFGYCVETEHKIFVCSLRTYPGWEKESTRSIICSMKRTLRHEIIHAFLCESGLAANSVVFSDGWACNEEMVDWFAMQGEKIHDAWEKTNGLFKTVEELEVQLEALKHE